MRTGTVTAITAARADWSECLVLVDGREEKAICYPVLTGPVTPGASVSLNTTAQVWQLGTGGHHFVTAVSGVQTDPQPAGHIMKCRYTPSQVKVFCAEEEGSPHRRGLQRVTDLDGVPVLVGSLHSQVPILAGVIKAAAPTARIVYIMTDGGALPAAYSTLIPKMKDAGLITATITAGHAFGGDIEAVNPFSAMAVAKNSLDADVAIVAMGPGVVGTGTSLGTTALEQAPLLNGVRAMGGRAIPVVRMSGADPRARHRGISHHTMTALTQFVHHHLEVPLPHGAPNGIGELVAEQAAALEAAGHRVRWTSAHGAYHAGKALLEQHGIYVTTMGRRDTDDPWFFYASAAAGRSAVDALEAALQRD